MKFLLSSLATAALALVASAAPTVIAPEVTTELPARFSMYLVTDEARANGLRIGFVNGHLGIKLNESPSSPLVDGVFLGGRSRIALDRTVHQNPDAPGHPVAWGDWNVAFFAGVSEVFVFSEEWQAVLESWGTGYHPIVGKFVQNSQNILRHIDDNGALKPNGLRVCGKFSNTYTFSWDDAPYLDCPVAEFRIVPL